MRRPIRKLRFSLVRSRTKMAISAGLYNLLQEAAHQRRDDPAVLYSLGWSAYATGKVNEARDLMQKVAAGDGNSHEISDAKKFLRFTMLDQDLKQLVAAEAEV